MPQVSLLPPLGVLGGRLPPGEPQAGVAAGPHAEEAGNVGRGPAGWWAQGTGAVW